MRTLGCLSVRSALSCLWLLPACAPELDVPAGATISCTTQDECPGDRVCSQALGRCVSTSSDGKPPVIESLTTAVDGDPARTVAAPGAVIVIDLTVDEPLGRDPTVELVWAGAIAAAARETNIGNDWTFAYDVRETDAQGYVSLVVTVVDADGLPAATERPRALFIDKTAAEIVVDWSAILPGPDNPLAGSVAEVDAGRAGSVLTVGLLLDEPVRALPVVTAVQTHDAEGTPVTGGATFELSPGIQDDDTLFLYSHTLSAPLMDGTYRLETSPTDEAGNVPAEPLVLEEAVVIDTTPPALPPDVDTPGVIVLQRIPWGSTATVAGDTFPFMVIGTEDAADPMITVIAYADDTRRRGLETGRGVTDPNGVFGFSVGGADVPVVWLTQVDAAGNESAAAQVRDLTWIATVGPGSPHAFDARTWLGGALDEGERTYQDGTALAPGNAGAVVTSGVAPGWHPAASSPEGPPGLLNHAMAYDAVRGRVVVHGGSTNTYANETWEWDGQSWELVCGGSTLCEAPVGAVSAVAFDSARGEVVLFGGDAAAADHCAGETWAWNGERWRLLCSGDTTCPGPPGLCGATATYDTARGRFVLFGGFTDPRDSSGSTVDSLWEWDGARWAERCGGSTGCTGPGPRRYAALAFDHARAESVLFGGGNDETWVWNGAAWQQRCQGACSRPSLLARHAIASGPAIGVWLMGGYPRTDELWSWDGSAWQLACGGSSACAGPSARDSLGLTVDTRRATLVLFGGAIAGWPVPPSNQTWEWHDGAWFQRGGVSAPRLPAVSEHAMVYSSADDRIVLHAVGETWVWDGALGAWRLTCGGTTGCFAPVATGHAMVYDPDRDRVILFGGVGSDQLQTFDGDGWSLECGLGSGCPGPSARNDHAIAYDTVRDEVVVFGGYDDDAAGVSDQTWLWNPDRDQWTLACGEGAASGCTGPSARDNTAMAFDEARGVAVLHGGNNHDDTWEWDGREWRPVCSSRANCAGSGGTRVWNHTLVYSTGRGTVLLFGGSERDGAQIFISFDLWEWDGQKWALRCGFDTGCVGPGARFGHSATYDRERAELVVAGGEYAGIGTYDDTWRFRDGAAERPAHRVAFAVGAAWERTPGAPDPFLCLNEPATCLLRSVSVRATAAGSYDDGAGVPGFGTRLLAWQDNAWRELGSFAGSATPAPVVFDLDAGEPPDPASQRALGGLLLGREALVHLALTPDGASGQLDSFARIVTDTVELELRYRLP